MSYPIEINQTAFIKLSNEPVFVLSIQDGQANVRRAISGQTGVRYEQDLFPVVELISERDQLIRELEFTKFSLGVREAYSQEYEDKQKKDREKAKMTVTIPPSVPDGSGYSN